MRGKLRFALATLLTTQVVFAYDSKCRLSSGVECEPGPETARHPWTAADGEHNRLWSLTLAGMGLPAYMESKVVLQVPTDGTKVAGTDFETVQPKPLKATTRIAEREYSVPEMAQLPDLSWSVWDWALGNEYCPIGDSEPVRACHRFASHMGTLNSNHFLPQSETYFRHYHQLAIERAAVCQRVRSSLIRKYEDFVQKCDQHAFIYEAIAHHFLQDAFSTGHMWPRWGGSSVSDFGGADWRERALLIALTTGVIHGAKGVAQEAIEENLPKNWSMFATSNPDAKDAMCAPINPSDYTCNATGFTCVGPDVQTLSAPSYVDGADGKIKPGVGDLYFTSLTSSSTYSSEFQGLLNCGRASIAEVAQAAGISVGTPSGPGPSSSQFSQTCFGNRVTNGTFLLGAGIDLVIDRVHIDAIKKDLPIIGMTQLTPTIDTTLYVRVPLSPVIAGRTVPKILNPLLEKLGITKYVDVEKGEGAADAIIFLAAQKGETTFTEAMKASYRRDLISLADYIGDRAKANRDGIDSQANLPPLLGISASNAGSLNRGTTADYADPKGPYKPNFTAPSGKNSLDDRRNAVARTFNRAFVADWCDVTTVKDLEELKTTEAGPLCEACAEFASRHVRFGKDASSYVKDQDKLPVCELLGTKEFVYLDIDPSKTPDLGWDDVGRMWCGCKDATGTCGGTILGSVVDAKTGKPVDLAVATFDASPSDKGGVAQSDMSGRFQTESLTCGSYSVEIKALGYLPATMSVQIDENGDMVQLVQLRAVDESCADMPSEVVGTVVDAKTGDAVAGATVEVRSGPDATLGQTAIASQQTDSDGSYSFKNLAGGYYTLNVTRSGYTPSGPVSSPACGNGVFQRDVSLVPTPQRALSFVLNWFHPDDLDLHLLLPDGNEVGFDPCAGSIDKPPFAQLDVDHKRADGPEGISVAKFSPGTYTLYVHNFSAQNFGGEDFTNSEAELLVYQQSELIDRVKVPASGGGFFWDVLQFSANEDGSNLEIKTLNRLTNQRANPNGDGEYSAACTPAVP